MIRIAVGTLRAAKLDAVRSALDRLERFPWPPEGRPEVVPVAVASGVPEMPMSESEGVAGARNRARSSVTPSIATPANATSARAVGRSVWSLEM